MKTEILYTPGSLTRPNFSAIIQVAILVPKRLRLQAQLKSITSLVSNGSSEILKIKPN